MTREEAIKILDPKTCRDALMEFMGGSWNQTQALTLIGEAQKMGLDALRAQENTLFNVPLTLEELREMDGEPVWCESEHRPDGSGWFLVDASALQPHEFIAIGRERGIPCAGIDTGYWLAYRRKPEEEMK